MNALIQYNSKQRGFSLIEVLISMVVVALGLLAIVGIQGKLIDSSGENKSKAEAIALAQARIEQIRNYTNTYQTEDDFNTNFISNAAASSTANGVNAVYTISESRGVSGDTKQVTVNVAWTDRNGDSQTVALTTKLGWESPRSVGDIAHSNATPQVTPPTGRAHLGEGAVDGWDLASLPDGTSNNGDNTYSYNDGSNDYKLVTADGVIVLTLEEACVSGGTCTDFVKINGRVWIDTGSQNQLAPGSVFVKASDAAYCQRYYVSGNTVHTVNNNTTTTLATTNGNYKYFDYTCYLGGGWHGNIGILLTAGLSQGDKICMGDPVSDDDWEEPVIQARRAYRGMLYKIDNTNTNEGTAGKKIDANGDVLYYSIGIADAAELPAAGGKGHDFVIASMATSKTDGSYCKSEGVMVRADSVGNPDSSDDGINDGDGQTLGSIFVDIPTDFVCLNPSNVDAYDLSVYGVGNTCPFDPTDPPVARHIVSGSITITGSPPQGFGATSDTDFLHTSDGLGNCSWSWSNSNNATFSCDVYDWGNGWNGYLQINADSSEISCNDNGSIDGTMDQRLNLTSIAENSSGHSLGCAVGNVVVVSGSVNLQNATKYITGGTVTNGGVGASCTVSADHLSYSCTTGVFSVIEDDMWSGNISFTLSNGHVCQYSVWNGVGSAASVNSSTDVASFTTVSPATYTLNLYVSNNTSCPIIP